MVNFLNKSLFFYLLFFITLTGSSYLGYLFVLLYIVFYVLSGRNIHITPKGTILLVMYLLILVVKYIQVGDVSKWSILTRFYFGMGPIIIYMYLSKVTANINKIIIILSIEVIIEVIAINFFIPASDLPNYPSDAVGGFEDGGFSYFKRPFSVGNNPTVSSTLICMLLTLQEMLCRRGAKRDKRADVLSAIAILVLVSGTGYALYAMYLAYRFFFSGKLKAANLLLFGIIALVFYMGFHMSILSEITAQKTSSEYTEFLLELKSVQNEQYMKYFTNPFLGLDCKNTPVITYGDFAWSELYLSFGILGIVFYILWVFSFINRRNWFPVLVGLIGAFHYGAIFNFAGQVLFAYILLLNNGTISRYIIAEEPKPIREKWCVVKNI